MFSASELVSVMQRRGAGPSSGVAGRATGASAEAIVAVLLARPGSPRAPESVPANLWAALLCLCQPGGVRDRREHRVARRLSLLLALLAQPFWIGLLLFLTHGRFLAPETPTGAGESTVQVVLIDRQPDADAGGAQPPGAPGPVQEPAQPQPQPTQVESATASPQVAARAPDNAPDAPEEPPPQALMVTRVPELDSTFSLPPPRPRAVVDVAVRERRMAEVQSGVVAAPALRAPEPVFEQPSRPTSMQVEVRERSVELAEDTLRVETPRPSARVELPAPRQVLIAPVEVELRTRRVPMAETPPAAEPDNAEQQMAGAAQPGEAPAAARRSEASVDEWGQPRRDGEASPQAGGLFDADGRPRLAGGGRVGGGLPPGTVTEDFARIDREGTWLRRPPTDYEPTSLDRFWVPSESLLDEWIRKSIKTVMIPIPGTNKSMQCNVALLMFGGACGITDPNMQDVETDGRPPPDVPWKPELQEAQDSL